MTKRDTTIDVKALLHTAVTEPGCVSDAFRAFHSYSFSNQILAWSQCQHRGLKLGPIATFKGWKKLGRHVTRGSKAITLCVPRRARIATDEIDPATGDAKLKDIVRGFAYLPRFFVLAQTDGSTMPTFDPIPNFDIDKCLEKLEITRAPFTLTDGNVQGMAWERHVTVNPIGDHQTRTLFHEIAHVVLGHTAKGKVLRDGATITRAQAELEAESVSYILAEIAGLPGSEQSRGYIQNWWTETDVPEESAKSVCKTVQQILDAGTVGAQPARARI
jgi:antirestriction protein ArdC